MSNIEIYTVSECYITLGGKNYPVTAFRLELSENSIPSITVGFDNHGTPNTSDKTAVEVKMLTPEDYFKLYQEAQTNCDNRVEADFTFTADSENDTQTISLKKWVCAISGFTRFTATGGLLFGLTLKHPAYKMCYSASNVTNITESQVADYYKDTAGATDPLQFLTYYMEKYASTSKPNTDVLQDLHKQYITTIGLIKDNFIARPAKFPSTGNNPPLDREIRACIYMYASNLLNSGNPFKFITDPFLSDWFLSAKPQYNGPFTVSPLEPWGEPKYSIEITNVTDFGFPSADLEPLAGVYISGYWLESTIASTFATSTQAKTIGTKSDAIACIPKVQTAYIPEGQTAYGAIQRYNPPQWATFGIVKAQNLSTMQAKTTTYPGGQSSGSYPSFMQVDPQMFEKYKQFLQRIVDDTFMLRYKASTSLSVVTRLMLQYEGEDLLPGAVCDIIDGSTALRFYITDVHHNVDVKGQQCQTEIQGRYVRHSKATCNGKIVVTSELYK